jgi:hypothetical protein
VAPAVSNSNKNCQQGIYAHGLTIAYDKKGKPVRFTGASDPRGTGLAKGI